MIDFLSSCNRLKVAFWEAKHGNAQRLSVYAKWTCTPGLPLCTGHTSSFPVCCLCGHLEVCACVLLQVQGRLLTKEQFSEELLFLLCIYFTCSLKAFFLSSFYLICFLSLFIWSLSYRNWSGFWPGSLPLLLQSSVWDWSNSESDAISASIIQMMLLTWNLPWPAAVMFHLQMLHWSLSFAWEALNFIEL